MSQPHDLGGLGLGTVGTSGVFLVTIFGLVAYLSKTRIDVSPSPAFQPVTVDNLDVSTGEAEA